MNSIITKRVINEATGEIETEYYQKTKERKRIKGGYNIMYHKNYEDITNSVIKSNKDMKLFNWITNQFTYQKVEVPITYSKCPIDISQSQFSKMVKLLLKEKYLMRVYRGIYRLNPFIYLPYKADGEALQREWKELCN